MNKLIANSKIQKDLLTEERAKAILVRIGRINENSMNIINDVTPFYSSLLDFASKQPEVARV